MCPKTDTPMKQGSTFKLALRWEELPLKYIPISAISLAYGPPRITAAAHGLPDGWRVAFVGVGGMTLLNATSSPPKAGEFTPARLISADVIELNEVLPIGLKPYTSGGFIVAYTPVDLTGAVLRATLRDSLTNAVIASSHAGTIETSVDEAGKLLGVVIQASVTAGFSWVRAKLEVEAQLPSDEVHVLFSEQFVLSAEAVTEVN